MHIVTSKVYNLRGDLFIVKTVLSMILNYSILCLKGDVGMAAHCNFTSEIALDNQMCKSSI